MKKFSRIICLMLVAVMSFSLVACNLFKGKQPDGTGEQTEPVTSTENSNEGNGDATPPANNNTGNGGNTGVNPGGSTSPDSTPSDQATEAVRMESSADSFTLSEIVYGVEDKFVYTATVSFERGVASGLAFGSEDGSHYWVFNVDRAANLVKLLYFTISDGQTKAVELLTDYFIGNDKMTDSERRLVGEKVATLDKVQLKVVITPEGDSVWAEFYADNIRILQA